MKRLLDATSFATSEDGIRSLAATVLGACISLIPPLTGRMNAETYAVVALIGAGVVVPVWKHAWRSLDTPMAILAFLMFVIGAALVGWMFSAGAIVTYAGCWGFCLGALRFVAKWKY